MTLQSSQQVKSNCNSHQIKVQSQTVTFYDLYIKLRPDHPGFLATTSTFSCIGSQFIAVAVTSQRRNVLCDFTKRNSKLWLLLRRASLFFLDFYLCPSKRKAEDQENSWERTERGKSFFSGGWCRRQIPFPPRSDSNREKTNACSSSRWTWVWSDDGLLSSVSFLLPPFLRRLSHFAASGYSVFAARADARSLRFFLRWKNLNPLEIITFHGGCLYIW